MCALSLHCNVGIFYVLYFSVWHKVTLKCSRFLTKCVSLDGLSSLLVGCVVHFIAYLRLLCSLLVCNDSRPHISKAAVYSTYITPRITLNQVFWIALILLIFCVRELWNAVEQYSVRLLICMQYNSIRSSIDTPTYFT